MAARKLLVRTPPRRLDFSAGQIANIAAGPKAFLVQPKTAWQRGTIVARNGGQRGGIGTAGTATARQRHGNGGQRHSTGVQRKATARQRGATGPLPTHKFWREHRNLRFCQRRQDALNYASFGNINVCMQHFLLVLRNAIFI